MSSSSKITCLLNWEATVYHAPLYLAQKLGYFEEQGVKVAILEPSDPSDVTEIIASGSCDLGLKAMIHTIAAKANSFNVTSLGTLLDEPETGVITLKSSGIKTIKDLKGRRVGYVGMFGKVIVDELMERNNMKKEDYTPVRVGMNVASELKRGTIDAGVGLENIQMVELEEWIKNENIDDEVHMLRIDDLADLGCCCFCSILHIGNDDFIAKNPEKVKAYLKAIKRAGEYIRKDPQTAYDQFAKLKPKLDNPVNRKMFERSIEYLSPTMMNVQRDWDKVTGYCCRLGIIDPSFKQNQTNEFLPEATDEELSLADKQDEHRQSKARAYRQCRC